MPTIEPAAMFKVGVIKWAVLQDVLHVLEMTQPNSALLQLLTDEMSAGEALGGELQAEPCAACQGKANAAEQARAEYGRGLSFDEQYGVFRWDGQSHGLDLEQAQDVMRALDNANTAAATAGASQLSRAITAEAELERLRGLINTPHIDEFHSAVGIEAAHQQERWGTDHDEGKTPADWFWLLGYLSGKALAAFLAGNRVKGLHHIISSAAVLLNWHKHASGQASRMRPGIADPTASNADGVREGGNG